MLKVNGLRPSAINDGDRIAYFEGISNASATFVVIDRPVAVTVTNTPAPSGGVCPMVIAVIEGSLFFMVLIGSTMLFKFYRKLERQKR